MKWFSPSWNGDHRLETVEEGKTCRLVIWDATPHEIQLLNLFLADLKTGGHVDKETALPEKELLIPAPIGVVAPLLIRHTQPKDRTITAVRYEGGRVEVVEGTGSALTEIAAKAEPPTTTTEKKPESTVVAPVDTKPVVLRWDESDEAGVKAARAAFGDLVSRGYTPYKANEKGEPHGNALKVFRKDNGPYVLVLEPEKPKVEEKDKGKAEAAVSTKRATPCCPQCMPGAIGPATEVLLTFLDEEQHRDWARHRVIEVVGGTTGHRYLLSHRHGRNGRRWGRICWDADDRNVLHFHDSSVPPEEEVLGAMLVLEHRENWLRNEATCLGGGFTDVLKNPFGGLLDGTESTGFTSRVGLFLSTVGQTLPVAVEVMKALKD